jgi:hypothetical protein
MGLELISMAMKFYLLSKPLPTRTRSDYTESELQQLGFEAQLACNKYRRLMRIGQCFLGLFGISIIVLLVIGALAPDFMHENFLIFWGIGMVSMITAICFLTQVPSCPACTNSILEYNRKYCPQCGVTLKSKGFFSKTKCSTCGELKRSRSGTNFKIHYCSSCGIHVDDIGM